MNTVEYSPEYNHLPLLLLCPECQGEYWRPGHWWHEQHCEIGPLTREMVLGGQHMPVNHSIQIGKLKLVDAKLVVEAVDKLSTVDTVVDKSVDTIPVDSVDRKAYQREWARQKRAEKKVKPT